MRTPRGDIGSALSFVRYVSKVRLMTRRNKSGAALSAVIAEYEQLDLERQFAQNMVTSTMQALDQSRASAASQHLYITPYVRPSLPESSTYPRRILEVVTVAALALIVWLIGLMIGRSVVERLG